MNKMTLMVIKYNGSFLNVSVKDDRLRCVKELVCAEEVFLQCLKCLFELYGEPLK